MRVRTVPDENKEQWAWIDEHIERPTPEIAGDEVLIVGKDNGTHRERDVTERASDEKQPDTDESTKSCADGK
jgi:hypothetical protein